jgi:tripartite-type tricarboxylate transporter receptor subunit TctC
MIAAGLLAPVAVPLVARAQTWPSGNIKVINPFPAGGASDSIIRLLQPGLQKRLGVNIIVENKPGASASIGATQVAKAAPDGNTWLLTSDTFTVAPLLLSNIPYDVQKDFEPVTMVARGAMVLCTHPSRPWRTLAELVAAAKEKPNTITYATTGAGGNGHLTMAALGPRTGMQLVHVPYRGFAPAANDAVAGHVDLAISSTASVAPFIESGQLRAIVQCGDKRAKFLPDTPTAIESGLAGFHTYSWFGFFAPAGTPRPIIERFYREVVATVREDETYNTLINKFRVEVPLHSPEELRKEIADELPFWGGIVRDNNIKAGG